MPSVSLHAKDSKPNELAHTLSNPLPPLLQTPSGLAILEIQGTIHAPLPSLQSSTLSSIDSLDGNLEQQTSSQTPIGRIEFPQYDSAQDAAHTGWMKQVYLYVGKHQRLTGEVKKLAKPLMVLGKRDTAQTGTNTEVGALASSEAEELEVLEVIRHKILFGGRPEPVGG